MDSRFEVSEVVRRLDPDRIDSDRFNWRAALLGAAVGVGGQAYGGTLIGNLSLWVMLSMGYTLKDAYAQIYSFTLTPNFILSLVLDVFILVACGQVAASLARNRPYQHGVVAGLMTTSFSVIMLLGPAPAGRPAWYGWLALILPIVGGIAGAHLHVRKRGRGNGG